ncbi:hypothetical protein GCM10010984_23370 [Chishuiella changwenlii]|uniref:Uncharacterized protein n=1 Tax=Chishuiella changwenlii TaxID=1434701 RepID=A0ABQ1TWD3_9FLAO|nr:hypothetical protein GCM10010984_23370 [Chishuiella changwenlii]
MLIFASFAISLTLAASIPLLAKIFSAACKIAICFSDNSIVFKIDDAKLNKRLINLKFFKYLFLKYFLNKFLLLIYERVFFALYMEV